MWARALLWCCLALPVACGGSSPPAGPTAAAPSILLVTLDTTRADAIGPDARDITTSSFNALAAKGLRFTHAYATAPETLPSHSSIMTGLYPAGHGVHENARRLSTAYPVLAAKLKERGYQTSAFVSSFVLAKRFGLARGFDVYDDTLPAGQVERPARSTTDAVLASLQTSTAQPLFVWVHYFDPHTPYQPAGAPPPANGAEARRAYLAEVASMDGELGRLLKAFDAHATSRASAPAFIVVGDHGEGLGDHGELQHGNLLYQSTMLVPLVIAGPGVPARVHDGPVSIRHVYHTILDWAGIDSQQSLRAANAAGPSEVVLGEAMKPFLGYGWQPQIMAVDGRQKAIIAGRTEVYDVIADPQEARNLGSGANLSAPLRKALDDYPVPSPDSTRPPENLSDEARRNLASLGYVGASATPVVRPDAPRPADMVGLFELLERASGLFVEEQYAAVIPLLDTILAADPNNLDAVLRLATAHSSLGHDAQALAAFKRAAAIAPRSADVRLYLALHYARGTRWPQAVPILEDILASSPERLPALEALAVIRERQDRLAEAIALRQKIVALKAPGREDYVRLGELAMRVQQTRLAIDAYERARALDSGRFADDLELGVLYLAARRFTDARDALDRVPPTSAEYPMALFKRAQVSVLLKEPDSAQRIAQARQKADATTRPLIASEKLFR